MQNTTKFSIGLQNFIEIGQAVLKGLNSKDEKAQTIFKLYDLENQPKLSIQCRSHTSLFEGHLSLNTLDGVDDDTETTWGVDGSQLKVILSVLPKIDSDISLTMSETARVLNVKACGNEYKLPVYEAPVFTKEEEITELAEVNAVSFLGNLSNVTKYTFAEDLSKNVPISCVHLFLKKEDNEAVFVATNSVVLAEIKQEVSALDGLDEDKTFLIKNIQANLLSANYGATDVLKLVTTKSKFGYVDKNGTLCLVSKVDLNPVNYEPIKSRVVSEQTVTFLREDFKFATDSLGKLCPSETNLNFNFNDRGLEIKNGNGDVMKIEIAGEFDDVKLSIVRANLPIIYSTLTEKATMAWGKEDKKKIVQFICLDENGKPIDNVFICLATNQGE